VAYLRASNKPCDASLFEQRLRLLQITRVEPFSELTPRGCGRLLARAGDEAKMGFKVHPHMLRHACGYALANKGIDTRTLQAYLGHRSINSTTRYAALAPGRFKNIWGKA
jgi:site-specific recombinase XerD